MVLLLIVLNAGNICFLQFTFELCLTNCGWQVPARIEKLISEKRYYAAVQLHLHSISMLDREGIQSVSLVIVIPHVGYIF